MTNASIEESREIQTQSTRGYWGCPHYVRTTYILRTRNRSTHSFRPWIYGLYRVSIEQSNERLVSFIPSSL